MNNVIQLDDERPTLPLINLRLCHHPTTGKLVVILSGSTDHLWEKTPGMTNVERLFWLADKMPEVAHWLRQTGEQLRAEGGESK